MSDRSTRLDCVFQALSDPTRRAVLARLSSGPAAVSALARPFDMALPSFTEHLRRLERCGLVRSHKRGRVRTYTISTRPLAEAENWMATQRSIWESRLDQLDELLVEMTRKEDVS